MYSLYSVTREATTKRGPCTTTRSSLSSPPKIKINKLKHTLRIELTELGWMVCRGSENGRSTGPLGAF